MKHILIVEDEPALLEIYVMLFTMQNDFIVAQASNGKEALERVSQQVPDVIILDILMPIMGGLEFLKAAKVKKKYPQTKVLVLSNLSDADTVKQVEKLGADKYLLKAGASPVELVDSVRSLLNT